MAVMLAATWGLIGYQIWYAPLTIEKGLTASEIDQKIKTRTTELTTLLSAAQTNLENEKQKRANAETQSSSLQAELGLRRQKFEQLESQFKDIAQSQAFMLATLQNLEPAGIWGEPPLKDPYPTGPMFNTKRFTHDEANALGDALRAVTYKVKSINLNAPTELFGVGKFEGWSSALQSLGADNAISKLQKFDNVVAETQKSIDRSINTNPVYGDDLRQVIGNPGFADLEKAVNGYIAGIKSISEKGCLPYAMESLRHNVIAVWLANRNLDYWQRSFLEKREPTARALIESAL